MVRRLGPRFVICLLASLLIPHTPAAALTEVDVALVLSVDISNSMDPEEQALQREGFVAAFRSPVVHDAIRKGAHGRIAVTYMEWAGTVTQNIVVPWTIIEDSGAASELADQLAQPQFAVRLEPQSLRLSIIAFCSWRGAAWRLLVAS